MSEFDDAAQAIIKANQQAREGFHAKSLQLVSSILADTEKELDDFNAGLEEEIRDIFARSGEDPTASGTDGSGVDASDSGGATQESGSGI